VKLSEAYEAKITRSEMAEFRNLTDGATPNDKGLWRRAKERSKEKFEKYPSAYSKAWACKWYKGKGGTWRTSS
tara:strand:- start:738 stop:956 length:219 start_codon:yes stop_codon:yes gene_type:complete